METPMKGTTKALKAADVMVTEPVCVEPCTTVRQLAKVLEDNEISGAPVVDHDGRVVGVVSRTDLIRRCSEGKVDLPPAYLFEVLGEQSGVDAQVIPEPLICVEDFMTEPAVTVTPQTPIGDVARLMSTKRIHRIVVVDQDQYPVGIVTTMDLLAAYSSEQ
jgi:CBS domain-containing protein